MLLGDTFRIFGLQLFLSELFLRGRRWWWLSSRIFLNCLFLPLLFSYLFRVPLFQHFILLLYFFIHLPLVSFLFFFFLLLFAQGFLPLLLKFGVVLLPFAGSSFLLGFNILDQSKLLSLRGIFNDSAFILHGLFFLNFIKQLPSVVLFN